MPAARSRRLLPESDASAPVGPAVGVPANHRRLKTDASTRRGRIPNVLKDYTKGKPLGSCAFGEVKVAKHKLTDYMVAIKTIKCQRMTNNEMEDRAKREINISKLLIHPHIIRLYEVFYTPTKIYAVMEYCKNGNLYDYIVQNGRLHEAEACRIFQQIIYGVEHCHKNMVVHHDLKPENLLLDSKFNVKLADFGLSDIMHDGHFLKASCGSPNYAAPEIISGNLYAGPEVDVWSSGVILYCLLCGGLPFDDDDILILFRKTKAGIYTLPSYLSALARDLIQRMLVVDPMKRITIHEIQEHPWFQIHIPRYVAVPLPSTSQAKMIDEDALRDVVNLGFDKDHVCQSLCNRLQNEATVAYYLLLDNRFPATSCYLGADYKELTNRNANQLSSTESTSSSTRYYLPGSNDVHNNGLHRLYPTETKWALGLQSHAHPREIMVEVLKALQKLNVCWKKNGHYNMKCKLCSNFHDIVDINNRFLSNLTIKDINDSPNGRIPIVIKFEMQLYKTRDNKYLLDLQRVTGPQLLFLDFCATFFTKLRVLQCDLFTFSAVDNQI